MRRGETADYSLGIRLGRPEFADGPSVGPDYWKVSAGGGFALNLRADPSTRYEAMDKRRKVEVTQSRSCRLSGSERRCAIRAAHSGVTGWVAGRYLVESVHRGRRRSIATRVVLMWRELLVGSQDYVRIDSLPRM